MNISIFLSKAAAAAAAAGWCCAIHKFAFAKKRYDRSFCGYALLLLICKLHFDTLYFSNVITFHFVKFRDSTVFISSSIITGPSAFFSSELKNYYQKKCCSVDFYFLAFMNNFHQKFQFRYYRRSFLCFFLLAFCFCCFFSNLLLHLSSPLHSSCEHGSKRNSNA